MGSGDGSGLGVGLGLGLGLGLGEGRGSGAVASTTGPEAGAMLDISAKTTNTATIPVAEKTSSHMRKLRFHDF